MRSQNFATKVVIIDSNTSVEKVSNEQRINRLRLQEELNEQQIEPLSFEVFEKTNEEIKILKDLRRTVSKSKKYKTMTFEQLKDVWNNTTK